MISKNRNPLRGWYRIFEFKIEQEIDIENLKWCICDDEMLALVIFDIGNFNNKEITEKELDKMRGVLRFFADNDKDIILRIVYDTVGRGLEKEPPYIDIILGHMRAIGPIITDFSDRIYVYQGLFFGSYGEMHNSKYLNENDIQLLYKTWKPYLKKIYLAFRTPQLFVNIDTDEYDTIFNDGIFGSGNHMGTYMDEQEREDIYKYNEMPVGGEVLSLQTKEVDFDKEEFIEELGKMNISYLNSTHDVKRLEQWKELGIYDEISDRLGYCFKIVSINKRILKAYICIKNIGFGPCLFDVVVSIRNSNGYILGKKVIEGAWHSGEEKKISCERFASQDDLIITINRASDNREILFDF